MLYPSHASESRHVARPCRRATSSHRRRARRTAGPGPAPGRTASPPAPGHSEHPGPCDSDDSDGAQAPPGPVPGAVCRARMLFRPRRLGDSDGVHLSQVGRRDPGVTVSESISRRNSTCNLCWSDYGQDLTRFRPHWRTVVTRRESNITGKPRPGDYRRYVGPGPVRRRDWHTGKRLGLGSTARRRLGSSGRIFRANSLPAPGSTWQTQVEVFRGSPFSPNPVLSSYPAGGPRPLSESGFDC
jgi:hypothetical protein